MPEKKRNRSPEESGPDTKNINRPDHSRCECESFGFCVLCSDPRVEAWRYRRPGIEMARVASRIARKRRATEAAAKSHTAHQLCLIWGGDSQ